ncbi:MAG: hypothetical protein HY815_06510, partial [Candidatus Riflebacteria bacterium]|nr:hypothetical protein [Candidatus Riflebacteria bacterium]
QARSMYEALRQVLEREGSGRAHVLRERVFLSGVDALFPAVETARQELYASAGVAHPLPPISVVDQSPGRPGQLCSLQAQVRIADERSGSGIVTHQGRAHYGTTRVIERDGLTEIYIASCVDEAALTTPRGFADQARAMFDGAATLLKRLGADFHDVARTWIFVDDIDTNYGMLNEVRTRFFREQGLQRLPASTGIQGTPYPSRLLCCMDLVAYRGGPGLEMEPMCAETLNEAPVYGSMFSRGMRLSTSDYTMLYVSGTASIDTEGRTVHVGDSARQTRRMFVNIRNLLTAQGATLHDVVSATSYLKDPGFYQEFRRIARDEGLLDSTPNNIVHGPVCRPDWLVEVEVTAALPGRGAQTFKTRRE